MTKEKLQQLLDLLKELENEYWNEKGDFDGWSISQTRAFIKAEIDKIED